MKYPVILLCCFTVLFIRCKKDDKKDVEYYQQECDKTLIINNTAPVECYTLYESYSPGDRVPLMIHSTDSVCNVKIYRYGLVNQLLLDTLVATEVQNYHCRSYSYGCDWTETCAWNVPGSATSGMYGAEVSDNAGNTSYAMFVVRGNGSSANIAVLASTNTWQAYNTWGGHSFYSYALNDDLPNSQMVSFHRPNKAATPYGNGGHLANAELYLLRWLEQKGYAYELYSDRDMHNGWVSKDKFKVLILNVHNEYWTYRMQHHLREFLKSGGNLMCLGANTMYWRVSYMDSERVIEVQKDGYVHTSGGGQGGYWKNLGMPEAAVLGVAYDVKGFDTYAPYEVELPSHWIFQGTSLVSGDQFGNNCLNRGGASGHETDKITLDSPQGIKLLARGTNPDNGGAMMTYYQRSSGAKVFSVGSITFTGSLPVDSAVSRITQNVLENFRQ